jgi:colanic acid biosynthesis glycosyl transferase WcaI
LLPALEGLIVPSKIYGILAAGRPALFIGDPAGDIATMLRRHDCGVVAKIGDGAGMAAELRRLRDDPARLATMGENARRLALMRYSSERAATEWVTVLDRLASPRPVAAQSGT